MPALNIDGRPVEVEEGATVLDAAGKLGISIPTLCSPGSGCNPDPVCLVCAVRDETADRIVPACAAKVSDGMAVRTSGGEVERARSAALSLLAAEHAGDCEAPCRRGCPLAVDGDALAGFLRAGDLTSAADVVFDRNPFPALTGRLCSAPCEKTCRRRALDGAVSIRLLERFVGDASSRRLPSRAPASGKKAAVVGAGPAGLSAAFHLLRAGVDVTVFEKTGRAGGGLLHCETDGRLPAAVLEAEIARVAVLGAELVFDTEAGRDVSWEEIARGRDLVVVACGAIGETSLEGLGVTTGESGIAVDRETFATSRPGVFAAGSAVRETTQSVHSLREGREAARAALALIAEGTAAPARKRFDSHLTGLTAEELAAFAARASVGPRNPKTDAGFTLDEAAAEARRCFSCACLKREECAFRKVMSSVPVERRVRLEKRPAVRFDDTHPDVVLEPGKCIKCGRCVRITRERGEPVGLAFLGRGIETTVAPPFGRGLKEALTVSAAECVAACPTGALAWKRGKAVNRA
ncbi:MAG: (2Fe-2S)-binding protein [Spirochaetales bacterium]|nr:(2Fe-2S)-binding protein [Spirochaetales bacterium]